MARASKRKRYLIVGGPPVLIDGQPVGVGQSFSAEALGDDHLLEHLLQSGQVVEDGVVVAFDPPVELPEYIDTVDEADDEADDEGAS